MQSSKGCVRLRNALKCISEANFTVMEKCRSRKLVGHECILLSLAVRSRLTVLTAGHERKHNACRAESEVISVGIPISEEHEALRICGEA